MKTSRKNPFAQATAYNGPAQPPMQQYNDEIAEDPTFQEISNNKGGFNTQGGGFKNRATNPFANQQTYAQEEDYSDFNPPNQRDDFNKPQQFSNVGWSTGERRTQPFGQFNAGSPNDFQADHSNQKFNEMGGAHHMVDDMHEPPLLEGKISVWVWAFVQGCTITRVLTLTLYRSRH